MKNHMTHQVLGVTPSAEPDWRSKMADHFQRTGAYRPEDVRRVLGNPQQKVEIVPSDEFEVVCRVVG